jgi:hypothetical protein
MGIVMKRAQYFLSSGGRPLAAFDSDLIRLRLAEGSSKPGEGPMYAAPASSARGAGKAKPQLEFAFA